MQAYKQYEPEFKAKGLWYEHRLIDDMVAQVRPVSPRISRMTSRRAGSPVHRPMGRTGTSVLSRHP